MTGILRLVKGNDQHKPDEGNSPKHCHDDTLCESLLSLSLRSFLLGPIPGIRDCQLCPAFSSQHSTTGFAYALARRAIAPTGTFGNA